MGASPQQKPGYEPSLRPLALCRLAAGSAASDEEEEGAH